MKDLNFIPRHYLEKKSHKHKTIFLSVVSAVYGVILVVGIVFPWLSVNQLEKQLKDLKTQSAQDVNYKQTEAQFEMVKQLCDDRENATSSIQKNGIDVLGTIDTIDNIFPQNIEINNFSISEIPKDTTDLLISLSGNAKTVSDMFSFVTYVRDSNSFSDVNFKSIIYNNVPASNINNQSLMNASNSANNSGTVGYQAFSFSVDLKLKIRK